MIVAQNKLPANVFFTVYFNVFSTSSLFYAALFVKLCYTQVGEFRSFLRYRKAFSIYLHLLGH